MKEEKKKASLSSKFDLNKLVLFLDQGRMTKGNKKIWIRTEANTRLSM